jgi:malate dehydrogenase (oxaloacetate-decarboxylating)(NADP+)
MTIWNYYHELMGRQGVSPTQAKNIVRTQSSVIAALTLKRGEVDAMLCGLVGVFPIHLRHATNIIGKEEGVKDYSTVTAMALPGGTFFCVILMLPPTLQLKKLLR